MATVTSFQYFFCSNHIKDLPIVLVFGVATTTAAVHRSLAQDASACVAMEVFQAQPSTHYLNHVIEQVCEISIAYRKKILSVILFCYFN